MNVWLSGEYHEQIEGLCGNFNGDYNDDRFPNGDNSPGSYNEIGDSWLVETDYEE